MLEKRGGIEDKQIVKSLFGWGVESQDGKWKIIKKLRTESEFGQRRFDSTARDFSRLWYWSGCTLWKQQISDRRDKREKPYHWETERLKLQQVIYDSRIHEQSSSSSHTVTIQFLKGYMEWEKDEDCIESSAWRRKGSLCSAHGWEHTGVGPGRRGGAPPFIFESSKADMPQSWRENWEVWWGWISLVEGWGIHAKLLFYSLIATSSFQRARRLRRCTAELQNSWCWDSWHHLPK